MHVLNKDLTYLKTNISNLIAFSLYLKQINIFNNINYTNNLIKIDNSYSIKNSYFIKYSFQEKDIQVSQDQNILNNTEINIDMKLQGEIKDYWRVNNDLENICLLHISNNVIDLRLKDDQYSIKDKIFCNKLQKVLVDFITPNSITFLNLD